MGVIETKTSPVEMSATIKKTAEAYFGKRHRVAEYPLVLPSHPVEKPLEAKPGSNLPSSITLSEIQQDRLTKIAEESWIKTGGKLPEKPFDPEVVKEIYVPINEFKITEVKQPNIGEEKLSSMTAEVTFSIKSYRTQIRSEWNSLKEHDVLFLLCIRPSFEPLGPDEADKATVSQRLGLQYVRGCEIIDIRDEEGNLMNDFTGRVKRDEWKPPKGEMRTVTVALDAAQYHIDVTDTVEKGAEDVYSMFNVLVRRKPKENNFKAILESIRDLMNEYCIVSEWLHNFFLGYGNPSAAQWPNMPNLLETVDFKDTFLDANHLSGIFSDYEVSFINADGAEALNQRPPFRITLPKTLKGNANALSGNKISEVNPADNVNMVDASSKEKLIVEAYTPPDPGPYPQDQPKQNSVKFTPTQVGAIISGIQPGLTMVVGPPGTGKTVTAVQILNVLYHNCPSQRTLIITHSNQTLNDLFEKIMELKLVSRHDPWAGSKDFLTEVVVSSFEKQQSQKEAINALPLYPNEQIMWDESVIPSINYSGGGCLALPKLNLQFLTLHDYLLRNFNLFPLESAYEIREDIQEAVPHLLAHINNEGETAFLGWSRMAVPMNDFKIAQADLGVKTIVAVNSSSDLHVQILRFLCYLLLVSSCTSPCGASTDEQQPRLPLDRPASRSLLHDLEPMWLLVAFVFGMAVVPLFKRILSWCKGSKKIKKRKKSRKDGKKIDNETEKIDDETEKIKDDSVGENINIAQGEIAVVEDDDSAVGIKVGKLHISSIDKTAFREKGYVVTGGTYKPELLVTVKCISLSYHPKIDGNKMDIENIEDEDDIKKDETKKKIKDEIDNEIKILRLSDAHPNIIKFHGYECENDVGYLCLEDWKYSLDDLPKFAHKQLSNHTQEVEELDAQGKVMLATNWWKAVGNPSSVMIDLIRDVVFGLQHLHKLDIIHRNLSPSKVIITCNLECFVAKVSDMRISNCILNRKMPFVDHPICFDDPGWEAPEQLHKTEETFATDMFRLGCVIFYAFTGYHPFGPLANREYNILHNRRINFSRVEKHPEAFDLIHRLLHPMMNSRPTSTMVLHHPIFWDSLKRLLFLRNASDRLEIAGKLIWSELAKEEKKVFQGFKTWDEKLDKGLFLHITRNDKYGVPIHTYQFNRLRHLLRMIRNEMSHYWEIPEEIKVRIGTYPEGFDSYFTSLFPKLLITVYQFVSERYMEENEFKMYFK